MADAVLAPDRWWPVEGYGSHPAGFTVRECEERNGALCVRLIGAPMIPRCKYGQLKLSGRFCNGWADPYATG